MRRGPIWVAVTDISGADQPSAGLAAAQALRRSGDGDFRILAVAGRAFGDGIQSFEVADELVLSPLPHVDPAAFVAALASRARGRTIVLLPGAPRDVVALAPHRQALDEARIAHRLPSSREIERLPFLGVRPGAHVAVPRWARVDGASVRLANLRGWRRPLVLRSLDGRIRRAERVGDVMSVTRGLEQADGRLTVHESVRGSELSVALLGDRRGRASGLVVARPLLRSENGALWSAVTTTDPCLLAPVRRLLGSLRWTGPGEVHLVVDERGKLWFTGLDPAFPSWVSLAEAAGQPIVHEYVRQALGAEPRALDGYRDAVLMSRVSVDLVAPLADLGRLATEGALIR